MEQGNLGDSFEIFIFETFESVLYVYSEQRKYTNMYPKVSGLAAWSENCRWYSSLPIGAVVSLFCESV
jgi:hypothetical protein